MENFMTAKRLPADANLEVDSIIGLFGDNAFNTKQFIDLFKSKYPKKWKEIVDQYGLGGKKSGNRFSSSGFIGRQLDFRSDKGKITKLERQKSPEGWGNDWILVWRAVTVLPQEDVYPDESGFDDPLFEGNSKPVLVNKYERSTKARENCIKYYGCDCSVCDMSFEKTYGLHGAGFIHVHHLKPLHHIKKGYVVDPIKDLRPVCPNCHAMIHFRGGLLSIEQARKLLK